MPLQVRRGPTADRILITPVEGELVVDTTENTLYVGDGVTPGGVAASSFTAEDAQDAAAALLTSGVHSNISFSYNDGANRIDATLNLQNYNGVIEADAFKGSLYSDDSSLLVDGVLGSINLNGTVRSNVIPWANEAYDLGSPTNKFRDLYLSGSSLWIGDAQITASGSAVNLPAGSTVNGTVIGAGSVSGDGVVEGSNYRINIIGEDSSLIVNSATGAVTAAGGFFGNITGNVTGDLTTQNIFAVDSSTITINNEVRIESNLQVNGDITTDQRIIGDLTGSILTGSGKVVYSAEDDFFNIKRINVLPDEFNPLRATIAFGNSEVVGETIFRINSNKQKSDLRFRYTDTSTTLPSSTVLGTLVFEKEDATGIVSNSIIASTYDNLLFFQLDGGSSATSKSARLNRNGNFGVGIILPEYKLDVAGDARISTNLLVQGSIVGDLNGSVFADNSTRIIDGTDGSITAGSFVQFGSLTSAERNQLVAVNGMVIYNTTNNRFEGYQNSAWINLDNGTAAGA